MEAGVYTGILREVSQIFLVDYVRKNENISRIKAERSEIIARRKLPVILDRKEAFKLKI